MYKIIDGLQELMPDLSGVAITQSTIIALKLIDVNFPFPFFKLKMSALDFDF